MKLKYILAYIVWIAEFYILFAVENNSISIVRWELMSRMHFNFYGIIVGAIFIMFWWIDDKFKTGLK